MKTQEIPANIRSAARLVAGAIRRIKSQQSSPQMAKILFTEKDWRIAGKRQSQQTPVLSRAHNGVHKIQPHAPSGYLDAVCCFKPPWR